MAQSQLPIQSLYLYKNGMAYVIRNGEIDRPLTFSFNRDDLNDILKNLIAFNPQTGVPYPVGYTTAIPAERLLQRFPFDLRSGGLASFLHQVRGAGLQIRVGNRTVTGRLMGVEAADRMSASRPQEAAKDQRLTLMAADGGLQNVWLTEVESLRFEENQLNQQLNDYLQIVRESGDQTAAEVTIQPAPEPGPIRVAYVQQFPVWKTSYRLELGQTNQLQGWVQIDNPTGEAWDQVELTLVSGSPVSFVMDLYPPLYSQRQTVAVPHQQAVGPVASERSLGRRAQSGPGRLAQAKSQMLDASAPAETMAMEEVMAVPPAPLRLQEAETQQLEDYFEYRFPFPITLQHRESALLPFLHRQIEAQKVVVFNRNNHPLHPYNSARLENSTGVPLEAGPVTVFQEGRYAGEAVLDYLNRGESGLISYGLDYETAVTRRASSQPERVVRLIIRSGVARFFKESLRTTRYLVKSNSDRPKSLVIEHPYNSSLKLRAPEPAEVTPSFYRFEVELEPQAELELPIQEIVSSQSSIGLSQLSRDQYLVYFSNLNLSEDLTARLNEVIAATAELNQLHQQQQDLEKQYERVKSDQGRIRENLAALGKSSAEKELSQRYVRQLQAQEDELDRLKQAWDEVNRLVDEKEQALDRLVQGLNFDGPVQQAR